jgi:hypothetical protein
MYKIPPDNLNSPYVHAIRDKPDGKHANLVSNTIGWKPQPLLHGHGFSQFRLIAWGASLQRCSHPSLEFF